MTTRDYIINYALAQFARRGERAPYEMDGVSVYPATCKTGLAVGVHGAIPHRVEALAVAYHDGAAQFAARWMCGNGSTNVAVLPNAIEYDDEICPACRTAQTPVVYRCYDAYGVLLYVGCTENLNRRIKGHERTSRWWDDVAKMTTEAFPNILAARRAERLAIRDEHPRFNRVHRKAVA